MIAVDTNVVIRFLTGDDAAQSERARALFAGEVIFLSKTVMLESEWVLRRLYRIDRIATLNALSDLMSLPNTRCEDEPALSDAFAWARRGMDFADASHLASARTAQRFATFDGDVVKRAGGIGKPVVYAL